MNFSRQADTAGGSTISSLELCLLVLCHLQLGPYQKHIMQMPQVLEKELFPEAFKCHQSDHPNQSTACEPCSSTSAAMATIAMSCSDQTSLCAPHTVIFSAWEDLNDLTEMRCEEQSHQSGDLCSQHAAEISIHSQRSVLPKQLLLVPSDLSGTFLQGHQQNNFERDNYSF